MNQVSSQSSDSFYNSEESKNSDLEQCLEEACIKKGKLLKSKSLKTDKIKQKANSSSDVSLSFNESRKDLLLKTILRYMRKSLKSDFYNIVNKKLWRYRGKGCNRFISDCRNFVEEKFPGIGQAEIEDKALFLGCLIKPQLIQKTDSSDVRANQLIKRLKKIFKSFSVKKLS